MNRRRGGTILVSALLIFAAFTIAVTDVSAATSPSLGDAVTYTILAGSTVTSTGPTTTNLNVGVAPGTSITGFPPGTAGPPGTIHSNDASAIAAQAANLIVFGALDQPCDQTPYADGTDLTATFPAGVGPGVYCSAGSFKLTGNLNLIGSGVWIFKTVSTLITFPGSSVTGGDPCNVWWRIGSSATLDTTTRFIGNILALTSITLKTGASLNGRALAQTGAVTLDSNTIGAICSVAGVHHIVVSPSTPAIGAGGTQTFTAEAFDVDDHSLGDVSTSVSTLWSIDAGAGGSWSGNVYASAKAGTWTVTATYLDKSGTTTLLVSHATTVDHIVVTPNPASVTAGGIQTFTATAYDSYGNSWDVSASASWSIDAGAGGSRALNVYTSEKAGAWEVTGIYSGKSGTATLDVSPGSLHHFSFDTISNPTSAISVTITAKDQWENTVTSYTGSNTLSDSTGTIMPTSTGAFTSGSWTGTVTIYKSQGNVVITTTGNGISGTSAAFDVGQDNGALPVGGSIASSNKIAILAPYLALTGMLAFTILFAGTRKRKST